MPVLIPQVLGMVELALLLAGCVLLWREGVSPDARERSVRAADAMPLWNLSPSNLLLLLWLVIAGGLLAQSLVVFGLRSFGFGSDAKLVIAGGAFHAGMLAGILSFRAFCNRDYARPTPAPEPHGVFASAFATMLIALPVLTAVSLVWQRLLELGGMKVEAQELIGIFADTDSPTLIATMVLLATVIAPVTEELLFRAGLFRYARKRFPRWVALTVPSLLFAALHANLASFAPLFVLGLIFSLAYERTGNIAVPIIAHGLFNLNTIAMIFAKLGV